MVACRFDGSLVGEIGAVQIPAEAADVPEGMADGSTWCIGGGPYRDESGSPLLDGGETAVLLPNSRWAGRGGETAVRGEEGEDLLVYHAYDPKSGKPSLQVSTIAWRDGWPVVGLATE